MAYICEKPKGSCSSCPHFRYDEDSHGNACFAAEDEKEAEDIRAKNPVRGMLKHKLATLTDDIDGKITELESITSFYNRSSNIKKLAEYASANLDNAATALKAIMSELND